MKNTVLFVNNLSYETEIEDLKELFSTYGEVLDAKIPLDKFTGMRVQYAYITMTSSEACQRSIQALHHSQLHGKKIEVIQSLPLKTIHPS